MTCHQISENAFPIRLIFQFFLSRLQGIFGSRLVRHSLSPPIKIASTESIYAIIK